MNKSAISISIFIIGLILLLLLISIFGILYFYWGNSKAIQDSLSTSGSILGTLATLGAAAIAAYLFNDWKEEKNYDLENSLLTNILIDLKPIFIELHQIKSDSQTLKKIDSTFIVKTSFLKRERIDMFKSIITLLPNIKIYSEIKKDDELIKLYNTFDKHCCCLDDFYRDLCLTKYRRYYELVNSQEPPEIIGGTGPISFDISRPYNAKRKDSLIIEIAEVLSVFKQDALTAKINNIEKKVTYDSWLEETINLHNQIQEYCIEHLKVN
ncbi:TPA: hypothetical protein JI173_09495 [Acinetobacter baumannii]|nr:hypothetical protein [Acinetobacter baumannii]